MTYEPRGTFSAMTIDAVKRGAALQTLALQHIHSQYRTLRDEPDPFKMHLNQLLAEMEEAYDSGSMDELNEKYRAVLQPFIDMIVNPPEQANA